jgi:Flp pilus assembly protein TadG
LIGMGLDFSTAIQKRAKLNAAADAAALAAVTPTMMTQSNSTAQTAAANMFNAVAAGATGTANIVPTINVTSTTNNGQLVRTVVVSYTASSTNNFPSVLGQAGWSISGSSTGTAQSPPNQDFYMLLDNSPSMALAATTAGITKLIQNTTAQTDGSGNYGCAFACHESNPTAGDVAGNPGCSVSPTSPSCEDNYALAKSLGVVTRIQNVASATSALMAQATTTEANNNVTCPGGQGCYNFAIYTFNTNSSTLCVGCGVTTIQTLTSSLSQAQASAATVDVLEVCSNNNITCAKSNSDEDTDFDNAMSYINGVIPNPGTGYSGSTPQKVLFIVTDGVEDKASATCSQTMTGGRCQQPFDTTWCTTIKNRGIFIAILYTEYLPLPPPGLPTGEGANAWYNSYVAPYQSQIGPNLQSCASPDLYFEVTTDQDISAAMQALFQKASQTARLSN